MAPAVCAVDGCKGSNCRRGLCNKHFREAASGRRPLPEPLKVFKKSVDVCTIQNCASVAEAKGLCSKHYQRFRRGYLTDEEASSRKHRRGPAVCTIDGCEDTHRARGYCYNHWYRWRHGMPMDKRVRIKRTADDLRYRNEAGQKQCVGCFEWHEESSYVRGSTSPDGLQSYCTTCRSRRQRTARLKRHYGLTIEGVDALLADQNHECLICGVGITNKNCHVDHAHSCCPGKTTCGRCVRGLLCSHCNTGLGAFKDSPEILGRAADYLLSWPLRGNRPAA